MKLKVGKINNVERKFIPIRKSKLEKYIEGLEFVETYQITQYYNENYKYREFKQEDIKYTKSQKDNETTIVEEISREEFLKKFNPNTVIVKQRKKYRDKKYTIEIDEFFRPVKMTIIEVSSDTSRLEDYKQDETFIEVTGNPIFQNENIIKGSIQKSEVIIEGTDGVGKTTVIKRLLEDGIICQDRCEEVISKNMLFDISTEECAKKIYERYFENETGETVVFLINLDRNELLNRIQGRENISEFDLEAYEYGLLYKKTYEYMIKKYNTKNRLLMLNCTGLNKQEQYTRVKELILKERSDNMKTALITGCNRGLGAGIRDVLLKEGYNVIGLNRTLSNEKINNYMEIECDISQEQKIQEIKEKIEKIDLLIINAGIRRFENIENMKIKDWKDSVDINLNGAFYTLNAFIEKVKEAKGDIIIIGSHSEKYTFAEGGAYCSTKLALRGLAECLREELRYEDIRVSYLSLGSIKNRDHGIYEEWKLMPEEIGEAIIKLIELPKKVYIPYLDIRPLQPLKDEKKGIEKLQYV